MRFTFAAGATVNGGYAIGDLTAELRRNATGTPSPFTLFRAESAIGRRAAVDARVGLALNRRLAVEVGVGYATPQLTVSIAEDPELQGAATASERLLQYTVDVSGLYQLPGVSLGSRAHPYVIGGGGYLRQLHEGRLRIETGRTVHLGAGLQYWLRGGANQRQRPLGARLEARLVRRTGGIEYEEKNRQYGAFTVLMFVGL